MRAHFPIQLSRLALCAVTALVAACDSSPTDLSDDRTFLLVVHPSSATLQPGRQLQLNVTSQGAEDRTLTAGDMLWSSTDAAVATVTAGGVVTAQGNGAAQITAWFEGHRAVASVKVIDRGGLGPCGNLAAAGNPSAEKLSNCNDAPPGGPGKQ